MSHRSFSSTGWRALGTELWMVNTTWAGMMEIRRALTTLTASLILASVFFTPVAAQPRERGQDDNDRVQVTLAPNSCADLRIVMQRGSFLGRVCNELQGETGQI